MWDEERVSAALVRLIERGVLTADQADAVIQELGEPAPAPAAEPSAEPQPQTTEAVEATEEPAAAATEPHHELKQGRLAEVAGYVGAALVAGAAILFLAQSWDDLGVLGRVTVLGGIAVVLAVTGALVAVSAEGPLSELRAGADPVRSRLTSTLFSGAAASAAFAAGLATDTGEPDQGGPLLAAGLVGLALAALGYWVASAAVAQLVMVVSAIVAGLGVMLLFESGEDYFGFLIMGVGILWAALAGVGPLRERQFGAGLGAVVSLLGAQWLLASAALDPWVSYVLTAAVAAAAFAAYAWLRSWPYLAVGVVGVTLAVTEFILDVTEGSLGAVGVLLVAGVTLLAASALGLRLRRTTVS